MKTIKSFEELNMFYSAQFIELADNKIFLPGAHFRFVRRQLRKRYKYQYKTLKRQERAKERLKNPTVSLWTTIKTWFSPRRKAEPQIAEQDLSRGTANERSDGCVILDEVSNTVPELAEPRVASQDVENATGE